MPKAALAVILLLNALPLFAKSKPVSIPFVISSDMVIVPATVNGTIPIHVILDTGDWSDLPRGLYLAKTEPGEQECSVTK